MMQFVTKEQSELQVVKKIKISTELQLLQSGGFYSVRFYFNHSSSM